MSDAVRIVEVGPRDGLQNEPRPIATADKVAFIDGSVFLRFAAEAKRRGVPIGELATEAMNKLLALTPEPSASAPLWLEITT